MDKVECPFRISIQREEACGTQKRKDQNKKRDW